MFGERYEILGQLGAGGFGVVYRARDRRRGSEVALKALTRVEPASLYQFKQEFRQLAEVVHPNLVQLHELGSEGGHWFLTMELVEGRDFVEHVRGSAERLRDALRQLALGVAALHAAGKLHRDLKPTNVRVTPEGRVVLLDFGLVRAPGPSEGLEGTPAYMAPELAAGAQLAEASDWWAVGAILHEALCGRTPFAERIREGGTVGLMQLVLAKQMAEVPAVSGPADLAELCAELLLRDPGKRPCGADVLRRLGESAPEEPARVPFVGRAEHLATLRSAYRDSRAGHSVTVLVEGPSGFGKTALVERFLGELDGAGDARTPQGAAPGPLVLAGRCYEQESVPYKALDGVVDALGRHLRALAPEELGQLLPRHHGALGRVFPALERTFGKSAEAPASPKEQQRRAFAALRELLARLADRRPLVLFIDDLQWGDLDSAGLLKELLAPPDPPQLLLVAAFRSEDHDAPVLAALHGEHHIEVGPLRPPEAAELATALAGSARADAVAAEAGGSPLFLAELARHGGKLAETSGGLRLDAVLRARVAELGVDTRRLLAAIAVAGRPTPLEPVQRAAALAGRVERPLAELRSARLVRVAGSGAERVVEAYHDRVRETVLRSLPATVRSSLHRSLADVLAGAAADPELVGAHYHAAGDLERARSWLGDAADRAFASLAFERAARLYRQSLELGAQGLHTKLADALANAGHGREAAAAYLEAAPLSARGEELALRQRAAAQLLSTGHFDEGLAVAAGVLASTGMRLPVYGPRELARVFLRRLWLRVRGFGFAERAGEPEALLRVDACWSVMTALRLADPVPGWLDFHTRALLLALDAGEPLRVARCLATEAFARALLGRDSQRLADRALALAERLGDPHAIAWATTMAASVAHLCRLEWRRMHALAEAAASQLRERCTGVTFELDTAEALALEGLLHLGRLDALSARLPALLAGARARSDLYAEAALGAVNLNAVLLAGDALERAEREVPALLERTAAGAGPWKHYWDLRGSVERALYAGDGWGAWERVLAAWPAVRFGFLFRIAAVRHACWRLRAYGALAAAAKTQGDERELLLGHALRAARELARPGHAPGAGVAALVRAAVASARGLPAEALLKDAAAAFGRADMALDAAACGYRLGVATGDGARVDEARAAMTRLAIARPERMLGVLAPGPWAREP